MCGRGEARGGGERREARGERGEARGERQRREARGERRDAYCECLRPLRVSGLAVPASPLSPLASRSRDPIDQRWQLLDFVEKVGRVVRSQLGTSEKAPECRNGYDSSRVS